MRTVVALARASHFAPTVAVTAFTTALAVAVGVGWRSALVAAAVLAGQLSVGWSNDWLDRHRDRAAGRADKPLVRGELGDDLVRNGAVAALGACAVLSLALGWWAGVVHLAAVVLAWSYNAGIKSTPVSVLPYMAAFGLLPAFVTLALQPPRWPPLWIVAGAALLGGGAHFANTLPDLRTDAETGVRGLPHRLGATGSLAAATVLLALGAAAVPLGTGQLNRPALVALVATAVAITAVPVTWVMGRRDASFTLAIAAAAGVLAMLLASGARLGG
jgi:4-hydroxybenzoate polyprenyltransferase